MNISEFSVHDRFHLSGTEQERVRAINIALKIGLNVFSARKAQAEKGKCSEPTIGWSDNQVIGCSSGTSMKTDYQEFIKRLYLIKKEYVRTGESNSTRFSNVSYLFKFGSHKAAHDFSSNIGGLYLHSSISSERLDLEPALEFKNGRINVRRPIWAEPVLVNEGEGVDALIACIRAEEALRQWAIEESGNSQPVMMAEQQNNQEKDEQLQDAPIEVGRGKEGRGVQRSDARRSCATGSRHPGNGATGATVQSRTGRGTVRITMEQQCYPF